MLGSLSALALALLPLAYAQDIDTNTVLSSLKSSKVIPDVIPANFTPRFPIEVVFTDKNNSRFPVTAGANLTIERSSLFLTFKPTFAHKFV
jgi:phosphatidylethanolamine-binding protein